MSAELKWKPGQSREFIARFRTRVLSEFTKAGPELETEIKRLMSTPGAGRIYISRRAKVTGQRVQGGRIGGKKIRGLKEGSKKTDRFVTFGAGTAKESTVRFRGTAHRASAPGQPPAVDTGELRAAVGWQSGRLAGEGSQPTLTAGIRSGAKGGGARLHRIAFALEKGTSSAGRSKNVRIEPRPAWVPAMVTILKKIRERIVAGGSK